MNKLTIVANIFIKKDKLEMVEAELMKLIDITKAEEGCLQYDLHQDNNNPLHFVFYENWENRDLWQKHMNAEHIKAYIKATDGCVETFDVYEMSMCK